MRDKVHKLGVIVAFLGISGIAEAITGQGSGTASLIFFITGLIMCTMGYTKGGEYENTEHLRKRR